MGWRQATVVGGGDPESDPFGAEDRQPRQPGIMQAEQPRQKAARSDVLHARCRGLAEDCGERYGEVPDRWAVGTFVQPEHGQPQLRGGRVARDRPVPLKLRA